MYQVFVFALLASKVLLQSFSGFQEVTRIKDASRRVVQGFLPAARHVLDQVPALPGHLFGAPLREITFISYHDLINQHIPCSPSAKRRASPYRYKFRPRLPFKKQPLSLGPRRISYAPSTGIRQRRADLASIAHPPPAHVPIDPASVSLMDELPLVCPAYNPLIEDIFNTLLASFGDLLHLVFSIVPDRHLVHYYVLTRLNKNLLRVSSAGEHDTAKRTLRVPRFTRASNASHNMLDGIHPVLRALPLKVTIQVEPGLKDHTVTAPPASAALSLVEMARRQATDKPSQCTQKAFNMHALASSFAIPLSQSTVAGILRHGLDKLLMDVLVVVFALAGALFWYYVTLGNLNVRARVLLALRRALDNPQAAKDGAARVETDISEFLLRALTQPVIVEEHDVDQGGVVVPNDVPMQFEGAVLPLPPLDYIDMMGMLLLVFLILYC
ncbi:hypothetical protein BOTBODRAFT_296259 [Botryobasidium botryosum FD-172 SS1]|uniref:Uncharacterized protein n=1 Tax=Botryobasidium botryosum (strain FD-172 SS1) TaxID=930990 RepID=A0A067MKJ4_BOTB1|nr:hypothetical protein BOTBODRAFT_296259 [Botryobasidium botryosum FD-172 SS1]